MGFRLIMRKTLVDLTGPVRTPLLILAGISIPVLVSLGWQWGLERLPLHMQTHYMLGNFLSISFIWIVGFFLALMVSATAASFISKESSDGTLLLLVSKPISRWQIVLGKLSALALNAIFLEAIILLLLVLLFWFLLPLEIDTFKALLGAIPWVVLYSLIVTLTLGSISIALSALMRSRVKIMVIVMVIIIFVFLFGFIAHVMFPETYEDYHLYYLDMSHHLGNIFIPFIEQAEGGQIIPQYHQALLYFTHASAPMESMPTLQYSDLSIGGVFYPAELTHYVSPAVSIGIWLAIFVIALGLAMVVIERKEVH